MTDILNGIDIANNIRAERNRANISQDEVCNQLNISKPTYVEYEKDASKIKMETIIMLSNIFQCNINSFFIK